MKRVTTIALAVGLPVAVLAIAGQSAFASAPPGTDPPGTDPPGTATPGTEAPGAPAAPELSGGDTLPEGFIPLVDDTGTIQVAVPDSWTDVVTAPEVVGDVQVPFIEASTDRQTYVDTFDVAGVTYRAVAFTEDTETLVGDFGLSSGCNEENTEEYSDGVFVGHHLVYTDCGGPAEFHVVAASPENQAFTAVLQIQITGPDEQEVLDTILDSFNMTATTGTTGTTVPGTTNIPTTVGDTAVTLPPTTTSALTPATAPVASGGEAAAGAFPAPSGEVPSDWTPLVDDTQTVSISVPPVWTDVDTAPGTNDDGSAMPWISASTDLQVFTETWDAAGVVLRALPYEADTNALVGGSDPGDCTDAGTQTYDDGEFVGHVRTLANCGGASASNVLIAVNSAADTSHTLLLVVQLTGEPTDAELLDGVLSSFGLVGAGTAPADTTMTTTAG